MIQHDPYLIWAGQIILGLLIAASLINKVLAPVIVQHHGTDVSLNISQRIVSWWVIMGVFIGALWLGPWGICILFSLVSFIALREFITLTPTKYADHRALFWAFFIILPYQYLLVAQQWYGLFAIFIPVYAFLLLPMRAVLKGDCENFLERVAKIQWALMVCVYFISHIPALLMLHLHGFEGRSASLVLFLVLVAQMSDVFQYIVGKWIGKTLIAPNVSPHKTAEGLVGGVILAVILGVALQKLTPFNGLQSAAVALVIAISGFIGGLIMSAIKRDIGLKDYGSCIKGHGGVLDRIDSLCFSAPLYFHLLRFYFS